MGRRRFTPEFKLESVKLVRKRRVSARQAAAAIGLHENVLRKLVRNLQSHREQAFPGEGGCDPIMRMSRRELAKTEAERGIWKKAIAYFEKEPREVRVHREALRDLTDARYVRGARCCAGRVLRVVALVSEPPKSRRSAVGGAGTRQL